MQERDLTARGAEAARSCPLVAPCGPAWGGVESVGRSRGEAMQRRLALTGGGLVILPDLERTYAFRSLRGLEDAAEEAGLTVCKERYVDNGVQAIVTNGWEKVFVTFYYNGNVFVQGRGPLKDRIERWHEDR